MKKLYVIRKFIYAKDAKEAMKLEKKRPIDDCWVDDDWKKANLDNPADKTMGYKK